MEWRLEVNGSGCKLCFVKNKDKGFPVYAMKVYRGVYTCAFVGFIS